MSSPEPTGDQPLAVTPPAASSLQTDSSRIARTAMRGTVWVALGNSIVTVIGFGANLVLARLLRPELFGFFSLAGFWIGLLNLRTKTGLNYAAIQRKELDGPLLGTYFVLDLLCTISSLALVALAALLVPMAGYAREVALAMVVLMGADSLSALVGPLALAMEKQLQVSRLMIVTLVAALLGYGGAIGLGLVGGGLWSLLLINLVLNAVSVVGVFWFCRQRLPQVLRLHWQFNRELAWQLLRQGLPTGLSLTAASNIVGQFDNFLVGTFVGYAALGYYDRAFRMAHWADIVLSVVVARLGFLTFTKVRDDLPRLTHTVRLSFWALTTLGVPFVLILMLGAHDVVSVFYGPVWEPSSQYLQLLAITSIVAPVAGQGFWLAVALGHRRASLALTATHMVALIGLATPLTIRFGVLGTIVGVDCAMLIALAINSYYVFRQVRLSPWQALGQPLVAAGAAGLVFLALSNLPGWHTWLPVGRLAALGVLIPLAYWLAAFGLAPGEMMVRMRYLVRLWFNSPSPMLERQSHDRGSSGV